MAQNVYYNSRQSVLRFFGRGESREENIYASPDQDMPVPPHSVGYPNQGPPSVNQAKMGIPFPHQQASNYSALELNLS